METVKVAEVNIPHCGICGKRIKKGDEYIEYNAGRGIDIKYSIHRDNRKTWSCNAVNPCYLHPRYASSYSIPYVSMTEEDKTFIPFL